MADAVDDLAPALAWQLAELGAANVVRVGVDLVEIDRIGRALERSGFAQRCFTESERAYCDLAVNPAERYAVRFSAKEAVLKALGLGLGGVRWHDIEIIRRSSGEPVLEVRGRGAELAHDLGIEHWLVTLTHSKHVAHALVIGLATPG